MTKKVWLIILIVVTSTVGCTGGQQPTFILSPSKPSSPFSTPSATLSVLTPTTASATSTTVVPTLSPEMAQATILGWLENNGNCWLPCIWKLEPGITTTKMRENLLEPFTMIEQENFGIYPTSEDNNSGGIGYSFQSDATHYLSISLHYYEEDGYISYLTLLTDVAYNDLRVFDDTDYKRLTQYYSLSQILSNYGLPTDVYLATWPYDPFVKSDYKPFIIVLVYAEVGFRVEYVFKADKLDHQIVGCPNESILTITTWQPKENISLQEIASIGIGYEFNGSSYEYFKPIDEVTSMTIEGFYNTFIDTKSETCLETPADLWP